MRIAIDRQACTGHGRCNATAEQVYPLDDLGFNAAPDGEVPAELEAEARRGVLNCPEQAITIIE